MNYVSERAESGRGTPARYERVYGGKESRGQRLVDVASPPPQVEDATASQERDDFLSPP